MFEVKIITLSVLLLAVYLLVWAIIPLSLTIVEKFWQFVARDEDFETPSVVNKVTRSRRYDTEDWILNGMLGLIVLLIGCFGMLKIGGFMGTEAINLLYLLIFLIPHTCRFVLDVCKNLKLNHKTGDAERISRLERELDELKEKNNGA